MHCTCIIYKPCLNLYSSKRESIGIPFIRQIMTYHRFLLLKSSLHFVDITTPDICPFTKLNKIWPIKCKAMDTSFVTVVTPEKYVSVDKALY